MTEWEELDRIIDYMETDEADVEDLQKFKAELIDKINEAQRDLQKNEEDQGDYEEAVNEAANDKDGKQKILIKKSLKNWKGSGKSLTTVFLNLTG